MKTTNTFNRNCIQTQQNNIWNVAEQHDYVTQFQIYFS